ncbi:3-oxoacyl-ACP reductase family protein [Zobellia galactanivorans]|uniref:Short-chain dehydrogenase/reductase n=1 Tax=Zobellia galactanivorans (strain DSM 12802 / CCUG 47099 / CIP 106680 / NCIMB 13871 / Dsij) TaxID=63186 RepID=G0LCA2_ZOBGA|nr:MULTISPECIES: 3-oxoacyl-ACP reductase family protein [Zobellia]MBU3027606.1 3-oxoacyl-ACP reductase FabG [Zobellia galactanivorans]MDO6806989.1 3-oxoacyl-ACP reductase family protein [Zobellia galactanivorans]OWW23897.1 oxidoreductase [Zobellia sp. OII3]CAZ96772.1 Short-chain dehydrogenase/reductase [Zobellia galactanivorans]
MDLKGKIAVVTGGTRDIGKAISLKLAKEGAKVVVNYYNNEANAKKTLDEIRAISGEAIIVKGDMTQKADVDHLVSEAIKAFGGTIDILVNNAGGLVARKSIAEMDEAFFNKVIALNLNSTFLVSQAILPHMKSGASIINIASQAGRDGGGGGSLAYATSKGAVMTFTRGLAKEVGPKNIRVNALCPGMIATTFHDTFTTGDVRKKVAGATPLRREGTAEEIANTVACLASDETTFITGANIDINGGLAFS